MDFAQSTLTIITLVAMIITLFLSLIPFVPGPLLVWGIAIVYGVLTGFNEFTLISAILATGLMALAMTKDFWLPVLGLRSGDVSCSSVFGTIVGGLIGTFFIPIPIVGTLLGAIGGAIVLEVLRVGDLKLALRAGGFAFRTFMISMVMEFLFSLAIIGVFLASVV